ncbi:MAG: NifB/NifX family molybdenum-iron cluster-binding protein [Bacteroidales bacterium]|nr:NifB/NifX family molybdenum-iron cluster-binding protein [Bacteroidales bacterium]MBN2698505.1 NifB/NifX family molybdenum-iron cluster-binding protein [Bacteroidales bacterium]
MVRKIAVPTSDGLLDEHFGHCRMFAIFDTNGREVLGDHLVDPPPHQPGLLPAWLAGKGVTDIIAGGMGQRAIQIFNQNCINVFVGAPKLTPAELVKGFLEESLTFNANYCDH